MHLNIPLLELKLYKESGPILWQLVINVDQDSEVIDKFVPSSPCCQLVHFKRNSLKRAELSKITVAYYRMNENLKVYGIKVDLYGTYYFLLRFKCCH